MKIQISNIEQFKVFFDVIYDVAYQDIELKFFMDRMTCAFLDGGRTRFFYVEFENIFFDVYDVAEVTSIVVSAKDMYNLLKLANKTDVLTMEFREEALSATLESSNGNKRLFEFILPDAFMNTPSFPDAKLEYHLDIQSSDIKQSVKDIKLIGTDIVQFVLSENTLTIMFDTMSDISDVTSVKYAQVIEDVPNGSTDVVTVRFNIDYIAQMLKFDKISKEIHIDIDERAMFYTMEDEIMGVRVKGMIAPRVIEMEE